MATPNCTTPTRRTRTPAAKLIASRPLPPPPSPPEHSPPTPLFIKNGDTFHEAPHATVLHCARHLTRAQFRPGAAVLDDFRSLQDFVMLQLGSREREVFALILLDVHDRLVEYVEIAEGTLDGATIYAREVVRCAVSRQAFSVVLVHNHPSGGSQPSAADRLLTHRLKAALALVEIRVRDHLVVGQRVTSMKEMGLL
jgi:DNA repair protein RadC